MTFAEKRFHYHTTAAAETLSRTRIYNVVEIYAEYIDKLRKCGIVSSPSIISPNARNVKQHSYHGNKNRKKRQG